MTPHWRVVRLRGRWCAVRVLRSDYDLPAQAVPPLPGVYV